MLVSVISTTSALAGLCVALIAGMLAGNSIELILERGLVSLGVCFLGGAIVGLLLQGIVERHAQELRITGLEDAANADSSLDPSGIESDDLQSSIGSAA